jgi:hypothetical protein
MNANLKRAGNLLAILLSLGAGAGRAADDIRLTSNYDAVDSVAAAPEFVTASYNAPAGGPNDKLVPKANPDSDCGGCGGCNQCTSCNGCRSGGFFRGLFSRSCDLPVLTCSPRIAGYGYSGLDSFHGITSGTYPGNTGAVNGFNLGGALLEDAGIGWQGGFTYGVYNFSGRTSPGAQLNEATQQTFTTIGLFRRGDADHRLSWGIVHDWMMTDNFGVFGNSPTLAQFRGQAAWALSAWNQIGVWGTIEDRYVTRATGALGTPVAYQAIDQGNVFWAHQYGAYGATSRFSVGIPLNDRLAQTANGFPVGGFGNTLGEFIVSSNWNVPINNYLSLVANGMYMKPSAHAGINAGGNVATAQEFWNVSFGVAISPGGNIRSKTIAGRAWMPYLPVANNSSFLVDSDKTE